MTSLRSRTIVVTNQKGGVGKTTVTTESAVQFASAGARVLVVDLDPQTNTTQLLLRDEAPRQSRGASFRTIYDLVADEVEVGQESPISAIVETEWSHILPDIYDGPGSIDLLPGDAAMSDVLWVDWVERTHDMTRLQRMLSDPALNDVYDVVLIDTAPSQKGDVKNALRCAAGAIIVTSPSALSTTGMSSTAEMWRALRAEYPNDCADVFGIVINGADIRLSAHQAQVTKISQEFPSLLWDPIIPLRAAVATSHEAFISVTAAPGPMAEGVARVFASHSARMLRSLGQARLSSFANTLAGIPAAVDLAADGQMPVGESASVVDLSGSPHSLTAEV